MEEEEEELIFQMALVEVEELQVLSGEAWMAMVEVLVLPEHHKNHHHPRNCCCIEMPPLLPLHAPVDTLAVVVVLVLEFEVGEEGPPQEEVVVLEVEKIAVVRQEERMLAALH